MQAKLISAGLEVETVEQLGAGLKGPLVVGQVLTIEELEGFKKPIRFCTVDVGDGQRHRRAAGDRLRRPQLRRRRQGRRGPARRRAARRLRDRRAQDLRQDLARHDLLRRRAGHGRRRHDGIIVLPPEHEVGTDAIELLELVDEVLDIAVTPDRGYCLSMRGVARETAIAYGLPLRDPALLDVPAPNAYGYPVKVADPAGCDRFTARTVTGLDPEARSPIWLQRRLQKVGHAPDLARRRHHQLRDAGARPAAARLRPRPGSRAPIGVRRAEPGEKLTTLDGVERVAGRRGPGHHRRPRARSASPA